MRIDAHVTPELEQELLDRQPWMHHYRLADDVIVGYYKGRLPDEVTACVSTSPRELIDAMSAAYERDMLLDPAYELRELVQRVGKEVHVLDIACASGWQTLTLADLDVEHVTGIEIRAEQIEQAKLIQSLDPERFAAARFEHEPTSADDPSFREGESYDVVMSLGLLYHLTDPYAHLENLRRLARRAVLVKTLTHAHERGYWFHVREGKEWMTKAWSGSSWIPHFADVPDLLRSVGFDRIEVLTRPAFRAAQARDARTPGRLAQLALPGAAWMLRAKLDARAAAREDLGTAPRYYTYLAR